MMENKKLFYGILIVVVLAIVGVSLFVYLNKSIPLPTRTIEQVKEQYEAELMSIEGVVGVGIGDCDGAPCIKVYLEKETPESILLPAEIEGFKVEKDIRGPIEALKEFCDAVNPCLAGKECYKFKDEDRPICWTGDPCEKCASKRCVVAESYPMQVFCQ